MNKIMDQWYQAFYADGYAFYNGPTSGNTVNFLRHNVRQWGLGLDWIEAFEPIEIERKYYDNSPELPIGDFICSSSGGLPIISPASGAVVSRALDGIGDLLPISTSLGYGLIWQPPVLNGCLRVLGFSEKEFLPGNALATQVVFDPTFERSAACFIDRQVPLRILVSTQFRCLYDEAGLTGMNFSEVNVINS